MGYLQLHDEQIEIMKRLRANGWSLEGIARVYRMYGVTVASVKWLVGEREESPILPAPRCRCTVLPLEP